MLLDAQTLATPTAERSIDRKAVGPISLKWTRLVDTGHPAPLAISNDADRAVLRRGPKIMVLFHGCPRSTVAGSLHQAGVTIGLALSPGELPTVRGLDDYNYVFVSTGRSARSALAEAVADLERNSWSVDDNPV